MAHMFVTHAFVVRHLLADSSGGYRPCRHGKIRAASDPAQRTLRHDDPQGIRRSVGEWGADYGTNTMKM
jgi:hypothetical protein